VTRERWIGLARRARAGDREAFGELVDIFQRPVCAVVYPLVHDWHITQDVAQDAFAAIYRQLPGMDDPAQFRSWLFRVARNRAVDRYRKRRRRGLTSIGGLEHADVKGVLKGAGYVLTDGTTAPHPSKAALERVRRAVLALPNDYGTVLLMKYVEGMSMAEIAVALGQTVKAIRSRLYRARIHAKDLLEKAGLNLERILHEM
jgi:RNA polymerase sigma-70 factor (ECF subfamily)